MGGFYHKIESLFGNIKFGVSTIFVFAIYLIVGTIIESYYGTDYANRVIYKSLSFQILQLLMFLSIMMATFKRFPLKKRLSGFYVLHLGLLLIFIGSLVTYIVGVDGILTMEPNLPSQEISLSEDQVQLFDANGSNITSVNLPYITMTNNLELSLGEGSPIKIKSFFSSAGKRVIWKKYPASVDTVTMGGLYNSVHLQLFNERFNEKFVLTLQNHPQFKSNLTLGPLSIHMMHENIIPCLKTQSDFFIWNLESFKCEEIPNLKEGTTKIRFKEIVFDAKKSAMPINLTGKEIPNSPYRLFNKIIFKDNPNLFVLGDSLAFFNQEEDQFTVKKMETGKFVSLPWMNFKIKPITISHTSYPEYDYYYQRPIPNAQGQFDQPLKVVKASIGEKDFWVTNERAFKIGDGMMSFYLRIGSKKLNLPYTLTLTKFNMDKNPGTNSPASYESFVNIFDGNQTQDHQQVKVFMNNPLKKNGFTFYQSSYFPIDQATYGSVLSVNFDPGRWIKYLGSLLLVFGSFWHFAVANRKKSKKSNSKPRPATIN
ncbi:cytochrome c biogenesis protein ResB [Bacteriovoracaceae bacterium]|nr:cytochrome c biogenesis protein ResB [Bacteriovoracaceae bacterium]